MTTICTRRMTLVIFPTQTAQASTRHQAILLNRTVFTLILLTRLRDGPSPIPHAESLMAWETSKGQTAMATSRSTVTVASMVIVTELTPATAETEETSTARRSTAHNTMIQHTQ